MLLLLARFNQNGNVKKGKATPITGLWGLEGSGRLRFQITRHSAHEVVRSSPLRTGRLYPQEYPGTQGKRKCQLPQNKFQASPLPTDL